MSTTFVLECVWKSVNVFEKKEHLARECEVFCAFNIVFLMTINGYHEYEVLGSRFE